MSSRIYSIYLSAAIFIVFLLQLAVPGFTEMFLLNADSFVEVWRFITSIFLHGDFAHLLFNLFALVLFGLMLEQLVGSKNFLLIFFVTGILANLVSVNFYANSLGASGAIFGIIGALIVIRPSLTVFAFGVPMPIIIAGILWAAADFIGVFSPSNVANIAHLAGMGFGIILGFFFRKPEPSLRRDKVIIEEGYMRNWEDRNLR